MCTLKVDVHPNCRVCGLDLHACVPKLQQLPSFVVLMMMFNGTSHMDTNAVFWNNLADKYAKKPVEDPGAFERKIDVTKAKMSSTDVVLDIGCGTGSLALRLASSGKHIHGLDFSNEMIRIARAKTKHQGVSNVSFHVGPFDESFTTFESGSFDGICAYSLLHLVADRKKVLQRIYELLKPGGFFVSSTVCLGASWLPYSAILATMRWLGKAPMVKVLRRQALCEEIHDIGFLDLREPDVGAKSEVAFIVAMKPALDEVTSS